VTRRALVGVATAALVLLAGACADDDGEAPAGSSAPATSTRTTAPPPPPALPDGAAWDRDFPDPFVVTVDGVHHAYSTTSGGLETPHLSSPDLTGWDGPDDALDGVAPWATASSTWAPTLLHREGRYLLYFTAQVTGTDRHCIGVAAATSPAGPFTHDQGEPLLCPHDMGGAIDPSPFVDDDGTAWLLWKNDGITLRRESAIWSQPLSADGRSLAGDPTPLIATDQRWEYPHVEAPSMARAGDTYWLAYSGNWWNQAAYGIGLARCASPNGPCDKPYDAPVIASGPGAEGPGGAEFFRDRSGRLLIAYHAWLDEPGYPGHRALHVEPVTVEGETLELGR
jgi:beta-xylosidase